MRAGKLDRRLTVQRKTLVANDGWNDTPAWADLVTVWAEKEHASEDVQNTDGGEYHFGIITFRSRWFADIRETDRILFEGEVFEIRGIREIGRREGLEFKAKAWTDTAQI